jgi:hypothetical protein
MVDMVCNRAGTPYIGLWERINLGVFLLWIAVLALVPWRGAPRPMGHPPPS